MGMWKEIKDFWRFRKDQSKRRFDAAKTSRLVDFFSSTKSADSEIRWDIRVLRDRCRDLSRNNDYAKKYIALMKTNVVGEHGVQMQSRARNEDNKLDKAANLILEREWREWCKKGNCTLDGKLSFIDCQTLVIDQISTEVECLIQIVRNAGNPWGGRDSHCINFSRESDWDTILPVAILRRDLILHSRERTEILFCV